jgi:Ca2+-binding RTX toxin-like protein
MRIWKFTGAALAAGAVAMALGPVALAATDVHACGPLLPNRCVQAPDIDPFYESIIDIQADQRDSRLRVRLRGEVLTVVSSDLLRTTSCKAEGRHRVTCPVRKESLDGNDGLLVSLGAGDDRLHLSGAAASVSPGPGDDVVATGSGDDLVYSSDGADRVRGGGGDDGFFADGNGRATYFGGPGGDSFSDGRGPDLFYGGSGDDGFGLAGPRGRPSQVVSCGSGFDEVSLHAKWEVAYLHRVGCEDVNKFD